MRFLLRVHQPNACLPKRLVKTFSSRAGDCNGKYGTHTIYALATPKGRAGVAVIRVSGEAVPDVYSRMVRLKGLSLKHAAMKRCEVLDSQKGSVIDDGMCVFFRAPKSFTTEHVLELHIHSSQATIARTLESLSSIPSCRPAQPGEFTQRAFLGGRIDLTQAEGLNDLIEAVTEEQRVLALRAVGGESSKLLEDARQKILECLAMVEALIDFGEGDTIEEGLYSNVQTRTKSLKELVDNFLRDSRRAEVVRSGLNLVLFGPPNVGKSSLMNFLGQRRAAIVTPIAGTTRDVLQLTIDLNGLPLIVCDTAGIRETEEEVELIGIERAVEAVQDSDISLCVLSLPDLLSPTTQSLRVEALDAVKPLLNKGDQIILCNKVDLAGTGLDVERIRNQILEATGCRACWFVSLTEGTGTGPFVEGLSSFLQQRFKDGAQSTPVVVRARQRHHLEDAASSLGAVLSYRPEDVVLAAEELRRAAHSIGSITGQVSTDEVLDEIFRGFCIGK